MSKLDKHETIDPTILRRYTITKKIGEGAYGHVWKVQDKLTKKTFALKKIFDAFRHSTDAQRTFRQIEILQQTNHSNIIKLYEVMKADNKKDVYLLFQFMEADLHNVIAQGILKQVHIVFIAYQIAKALKYLHSGLIIHRDLKPSNILINSNCTIKLCDFGLVRSIFQTNSAPVMTEEVATRWYRAPQVLLRSKRYSKPADVWSFGCIIYQALKQRPLFPGQSTLDQLQKIIAFVGKLTEEDINSLQCDFAQKVIKQLKYGKQHETQSQLFEGIPQGFKDLLKKMLRFNPRHRIMIEDILANPLFKKFRKIQEQISCQQELKTSIDDNTKLSVEQYRKLIYRRRTLATSFSTVALNKTISPKNVKNGKFISNKINESLVNTNSNSMSNLNKQKMIEKPKQQIEKKVDSKLEEIKQFEKQEKRTLNYVKSNKQLPKKLSGYFYSKNSPNSKIQKKQTSKLDASINNSQTNKIENGQKLSAINKYAVTSQKDLNKVRYITSTTFYSPKNALSSNNPEKMKSISFINKSKSTLFSVHEQPINKQKIQQHKQQAQTKTQPKKQIKKVLHKIPGVPTNGKFISLNNSTIKDVKSK